MGAIHLRIYVDWLAPRKDAGVVRRAALAYRGARHGEATLGGEAVLRRLAAIGAGDVSGYSRLLKTDREGPLARLGSPGHDLIDPKIALHKRRTLGTARALEAASIVAAG